MKIIVGTIIKKDDKILMVKEAKKECFEKWDFPTGRLEANEDIFECAIRETLEETGYKVVLKRMLPIQILGTDKEKVYRFMFLADSLEYDESKIIKNEILETKFISISEIKNMHNKLRDSKGMLDIIEVLENEKWIKLDDIFM